MKEQDAKQLLEKIREGTATEQERALVDSWYLSYREHEPGSLTAEDYEIAELLMYSKLPAAKNTVSLWPRIRVAAGVAAAVMAIALCVYFFVAPRDQDSPSSQTAGRDHLNYAADIAPGRSGATITLANGKVIQLSGAKRGVVIAGKTGTEELKYDDGSVVRYSSGSQGADGKAAGLTASTAKGQTYQFTLPDGTKVWLNADSKISFPVQFNGPERKILLSGEGYFEVAKDKDHPFVVTAGAEKIEVLGTHFNLNTFGDEHRGTVTSLLEGSVKMTGREGSRVLKPGERGVSTIKGILLLRGDAGDDVDWKSGFFKFNEEPLAEIMNKVARWYNVEVVYEQDNLKQVPFSGTVSRFEQVSRLLDKLERTGLVRFKIEERRIVVMK